MPTRTYDWKAFLESIPHARAMISIDTLLFIETESTFIQERIVNKSPFLARRNESAAERIPRRIALYVGTRAQLPLRSWASR